MSDTEKLDLMLGKFPENSLEKQENGSKIEVH